MLWFLLLRNFFEIRECSALKLHSTLIRTRRVSLIVNASPRTFLYLQAVSVETTRIVTKGNLHGTTVIWGNYTNYMCSVRNGNVWLFWKYIARLSLGFSSILFSCYVNLVWDYWKKYIKYFLQDILTYILYWL